MLLDQNGKQLKNQCCGFARGGRCTKEIDAPGFFCPKCLSYVPKHLKDVLRKEVAWMNKHKVALDQGFQNLLMLCVNRGLVKRIAQDPELLKEIERENVGARPKLVLANSAEIAKVIAAK